MVLRLGFSRPQANAGLHGLKPSQLYALHFRVLSRPARAGGLKYFCAVKAWFSDAWRYASKSSVT
jgi:hypothetical protein